MLTNYSQTENLPLLQCLVKRLGNIGRNLGIARIVIQLKNSNPSNVILFIVRIQVIIIRYRYRDAMSSAAGQNDHQQ